MELLPPPDFFESYDFNFLTTEIFHAQEKGFDVPSLKDGEIFQLDWRENETNDKHGSNESLTGNSNSPTLGAIGSEISEAKDKNTEPFDIEIDAEPAATEE